MNSFRVRQGRRVGRAFAVFRYTAVVQWDGEMERDIAWLNDLEVIGYDTPALSEEVA